MTIDGSVNFRRINDTLTTSGLVSAEQVASLGDDGYQAVINLLPDDSEHTLATEEALVTGQGLDYVHIPVDFAAPTHADLEAFAAAMDDHRDQLVHVHCAANYRVSVFYGLYASRRGLCTVEDADELVHGLWDPAQHPAWATFIADERARGGQSDVER